MKSLVFVSLCTSLPRPNIITEYALSHNTGSQDVNDEFSKLSAHEAKQRLAVLLRRMDTNGDSFISNEEISDWVLNNFRSVWTLIVSCLLKCMCMCVSCFIYEVVPHLQSLLTYDSSLLLSLG